jgi:putative N6-adenine-specific DNA methylase
MVTIFLPCAGGVEALLQAETQRILPSAALTAGRGGVFVEGVSNGFEEAMRLNLESRLAQRVLLQVAQGPYRQENDIYALTKSVTWSQWMTLRQTLRVDVTAHRCELQSLNFAALRVKDAVCDHFLDISGERPDVDTRRPDLQLVLHLSSEVATLYVDTSGEGLFKRGWREDKGEAPLKETLAAAMLAAADWQGRPDDGPLFDPCCGAGTIVIEAAQMACGLAPGLQRRFAFERLLPFKRLVSVWQAMRDHAHQRVHEPAVPIFAGDVAFRMTDFATRNAERAGVRHAIEFKTADALQHAAPDITRWGHGTLMFNPPYGERVDVKGQAKAGMPSKPQGREAFEDGTAASDFFAGLATHWKRNYPGWRAWVLSPDMKLPSVMRFKESRRVPLWNGPIECRLFRFDIVAGSAREKTLAQPTSSSS